MGMEPSPPPALRELWAEARDLVAGGGVEDADDGYGVVERLAEAPSPMEFLRNYVAPNRPVIVSAAAATRHWPASTLWSADHRHLLRVLRGRSVSLHLTPDGRADALVPNPTPGATDALCFASACVAPVDFAAAIRMIEHPGGDGSLVAYAQQQDDCLRKEYGPLAGDVAEHIPWATEALGALPEAVNLWIGGARSQTSFHKDHYENLYAVISGEKHFLLLPPTEFHRLYVRSYPAATYALSSTTQQKDLTGDDDVRNAALELHLEVPERRVLWCSVDPYPASPEAMASQKSSFPLYFDGPKPFQCTVRAGEILYLPSMWFHHVRQTPDHNGRTIAVNYWYDMQFDIKYAYFNFLRSLDLLQLSTSPPAINQKSAGHTVEGDPDEHSGDL